jgi:hypothetical protein
MSTKGKEKRHNRSIGVIIAIILAVSALVLAGFNTIMVLMQLSSGTPIDTQKSLVRVYLNNSYNTAANDVVRLNFTTTTLDLYSDFDLEQDQFTSPNDGYYRFDLHLEMASSSTMILLVMLRDGEIYSQGTYSDNYRSLSYSDIAYLESGTIVNFTLRFGGAIGQVIGSATGERTRLLIEEL